MRATGKSCTPLPAPPAYAGPRALPTAAGGAGRCGAVPSRAALQAGGAAVRAPHITGCPRGSARHARTAALGLGRGEYVLAAGLRAGDRSGRRNAKGHDGKQPLDSSSLVCGDGSQTAVLKGGRGASPCHNMAPRASPPDGGWGWMIVAGCFLVTICTRAVTRCISIFFVEFQAYFGQDYARTAWIHSIVDCATMLCAPLGSFISNHVSCQVGIMLGGLLSSTGLILSSFATSLEHLYLSLGVLTGLGFALCYSPAIAMVGKYFNKRKALAYGIAMSGSGIGTFILAPVVQLLIEQFSWRGALLILGGFVLNLCVCGALMRPIALEEDRKTVPGLLEKDYVPEAQKQDLKRMSLCSPLIKTWSHECLCYCSWKEYDFLLMPGFMVLAVSVLFMAYGCSPLFVYLVPYALSVGVSHHQAAFLMSILGVIDIIGNITFGWLTDRRCLKKHRYFCYLFAVGMDGLCCLFLPVLQNFPLLVPFSFTFGYFDGAYVTLIPVVTADVVGTSSLSSALGVVYFLHAIPYLVSPPVAGWLVDTTGSYTASFLLCGFSMIFSSVLLCFARLAKKMKRTHLKSLSTDTHSKQHIWTNGAIAYSVTGELDQKDAEFLPVDTNSYSNR